MTTQELKQYIDKVLGNSIRCLLPSYWWKRLFTSLADRVDEVEQSTSKLIENKVNEVKMPIVESEDELSKLDLPKGSVAAADSYGKINPYECYCLSFDKEPSANAVIDDWDKFKRITHIDVTYPESEPSDMPTLYLHRRTLFPDGLIQLSYYQGGYKISMSSVSLISISRLNQYLENYDYRLIAIGDSEEIVNFFNKHVSLYSPYATTELYIKGDSWERLAKESDIQGGESGGVIAIYEGETSQRNADAYNKIKECHEKVLPINAVVVKDGMSYAASVGFTDFLNTGTYVAIAEFVRTTDAVVKTVSVMLGLVQDTGEGFAEKFAEIESGNGAEIREIYIYDYNGNITELTDEQKAWNLETLELAKQGKAIVRITLHGNTFILELFNEDNEYQFGYTQFSPSGGVAISVYVAEDGLSGVKIEESHFDSELSTTSINAVQNKAVYAALQNFANDFQFSINNLSESDRQISQEVNNKVDKTYVDNAIANAITTTLNTEV